MPYCPKCFAEYIEGTDDCDDCHVHLLPGSPPRPSGHAEAEPRRAPTGHTIGELLQSLLGAGKAVGDEDVKLVRIKTFTGPTAVMDADLARNLLRAQGIPSILPGEASVGMLPVLEIPLLVPEPDAERATAILRDYSEPCGPILLK